MTQSSHTTTFFLAGGGRPIAATFDDVVQTGAPRTGTLIVPPFGWEAMCSHRARRDWARALAASGSPALRIDLPAAGDSDGMPSDPDLLPAWIAAVDTAVHWLRGEGGCRRVAVIGIELGGILAACATSAGTPVDDLVLWNVPARGRSLVRELQAFSRFEGTPPPPDDDPADGPAPDGTLVAGGYLMSAQTTAAVSAIDLSDGLAIAPATRVLLLGRDDRAPDRRLVEALEASGCDLTTRPGLGYAAMTAEPVDAVPPRATIDAVAQWLA